MSLTHAECLVHSESGSLLLMTEEERNRKIKEELSASLEDAEGERGVSPQPRRR